MRKTEVVVKDELEAAAVFDQVKAAVDAAEKSLAQINAADEESDSTTDSESDIDEELPQVWPSMLSFKFCERCNLACLQDIYACSVLHAVRLPLSCPASCENNIAMCKARQAQAAST